MRRRDALLWLAAAAGPTGWFLDLVVSWAIAPDAHEGGDTLGLHLVTGAALVMAAGGLVLAWSLARALARESRRVAEREPDRGPGAGPDAARRIERARFLALAGIALSLFSILLILGTAIPKWGLTPGMEP